LNEKRKLQAEKVIFCDASSVAQMAKRMQYRSSVVLRFR